MLVVAHATMQRILNALSSLPIGDVLHFVINVITMTQQGGINTDSALIALIDGLAVNCPR